MDFFYRNKPWYAGQFVRKIEPKFETNKNLVLFCSTILNKQKSKLLSVLVRHVDQTFMNSTAQFPILENGKIDFEFINSFVAELEAERVAELEAYLTASGLKDYALTEEESLLVKDLENIKFKEFNVTDIFDVKNTSNILSRDIVDNSGTVPYLCASANNNSVSSYISYDNAYLTKGNCIFIGGKTFVVTYQEHDFYSNDSHNLVLQLKEQSFANEDTYLYLASCIKKSLGHKYSWGDSISSKKIQSDLVMLPSKDGKPDYEIMRTISLLVKKLTIKDVVEYADRKILTTKRVIKH